MKKYIIMSAILILVALEVYLLNMKPTTLYPDINEALKEIGTSDSERIVWHLENFSMNGENYKEISFLLEENSARIVSLKTDEDVLRIPARLGNYPVIKIGGQLEEIQAATEEAKKDKKLPYIGVHAWMMNKNHRYKKIILEEGIKTIYAESFYGVRSDVLELPQSLELIGALAFGESQIDEIKAANNKMCMEWDVFWGTKHQKSFPESSLANLSQINEKFYKTYHLD